VPISLRETRCPYGFDRRIGTAFLENVIALSKFATLFENINLLKSAFERAISTPGYIALFVEIVETTL
jgi:hypothetical protein